MADKRSIEITLKLGQATDAGSVGSEDSSNPANTAEVSSKTDKSSTVKALAGYVAMQTAQMVTSEVTNWAEYFINRQMMLEDDYIGQRNKSIAMTQINRGIGVISNIGSSIVAGAAIGGAGGAIAGAILGAATSITGIIRSNVQGELEQDLTLRQMDAQLSYTRSRAGWSTKAASIGEDL